MTQSKPQYVPGLPPRYRHSLRKAMRIDFEGISRQIFFLSDSQGHCHIHCPVYTQAHYQVLYGVYYQVLTQIESEVEVQVRSKVLSTIQTQLEEGHED